MKVNLRLKKSFITYSLFASFAAILFNACVEPFEPETVEFESALVVEATITDEIKQQEIFLTRTYKFEDDGPDAERNATVRVLDDSGNSFDFQEAEAGIYLSTVPFRAENGRTYTLTIQTSDGRTYSSLESQVPSASSIEQVYAERITNSFGEEGVGIFLDSFDPQGNSRNYRFLYEETYKIIAPKWTDQQMVSTGIECGVDVEPKTVMDETCFNTEVSKDLIITDTNGFNEDRISAFMVRFINRDNYIISHRYSILVRQLIQSDAAYSFFETLNSFSGSESLFSDTQVGFLNGNVFSDTDTNEKVLGFFDVATITEQRIFFDYEDLFPGEPLPPFVSDCVETAPVLIIPGGDRCVLAAQVEADVVRYVSPNDPPIDPGGPYRVVPRVCGDCTTLGKTEIPEFWTEN